jgi:hypothetical protein
LTINSPAKLGFRIPQLVEGLAGLKMLICRHHAIVVPLLLELNSLTIKSRDKSGIPDPSTCEGLTRARKSRVEGNRFLCYTAGQENRRLDMPDPKIEFLYWEECPSHPEARKRLREVMAEMGLETEVEEIEVLTDEDARRLRFPGSPTIRVDDVDVDPAGASQMGTALTCRVYRLEDGRFSPVPSRDMIRQALRTR